MHYAVFRQYAAVKPILFQMLASPRAECARTGGGRKTVAGLWLDEAEDDLAAALRGGEHVRAGVAGVFAANLAHANVMEKCEYYLRALFLDESSENRIAASTCWRNLSPDEIAARGSLLAAFAESPAFADGEHLLFHRLREARRALGRAMSPG